MGSRRKRLLQAPVSSFRPLVTIFWEFFVECLDWSCQGAAGTHVLVSQRTKRLTGGGFRCMCPEQEAMLQREKHRDRERQRSREREIKGWGAREREFCSIGRRRLLLCRRREGKDGWQWVLLFGCAWRVTAKQSGALAIQSTIWRSRSISMMSGTTSTKKVAPAIHAALPVLHASFWLKRAVLLAALLAF